eukprot:1145816-Pelagomonas_calceolata.AAC.4
MEFAMRTLSCSNLHSFAGGAGAAGMAATGCAAGPLAGLRRRQQGPLLLGTFNRAQQSIFRWEKKCKFVPFGVYLQDVCRESAGVQKPAVALWSCGQVVCDGDWACGLQSKDVTYAPLSACNMCAR